MKNFILVKKDIDVSAIEQELLRGEEAWKVDLSRQNNIRCQRETESILLRVANKTGEIPVIEDVQDSVDCPVALAFPVTMAWMAAVANALGGELGRALFARLRPHGQVYRHIDHGSYYARRDRFHLVIKSDGSLMNCGDEDVVMQRGEFWVFNNKKRHQAFNESSQPRVHLIFDLLLRDALL